MDLFKNLIDDNINLQEVLKDQIKFKSDLREIKKTKSKSENQVSVMIESTEFRDSIPLEAQKIFNKLVVERSSQFWNLEKTINCDNLI